MFMGEDTSALEGPWLSKGSLNMLLNLGGFCEHPPLAPALGRRVIDRQLHSCSFACKKRLLERLP